jgi:predicted dehydrogenase
MRAREHAPPDQRAMNEERTTIRFAIAGTGPRVRRHALALARIEDATGIARSVAGDDSLPSELQHTPNFESWQSMLQQTKPDVVVSCIDWPEQSEIARAAIAAGANFLYEEPLAEDVATALSLARAAARAKVSIAPASPFRFSSDIARAKTIVSVGALGDVLQVAIVRDSNPAGFAAAEVEAANARALNCLLYVGGPIVSVCAPQSVTPEEGRVLVRFERGNFGVVHGGTQKPSRYIMQLVGTQGRMAISEDQTLYRAASSDTWFWFGNGYSEVRALTRQYEAIVARLQVSDEPIAVDYAVRLAPVLAALRASLPTAQWHDVEQKSAPLHEAGERMSCSVP